MDYGKTAGYTCNYCSREYKEKFNYDRHHVYCEFVNKTPREQNNQIEQKETTLPSITQMYHWMQEMAVRIDKLEKENIKLKRVQKKINIIEWLNTSKLVTQPEMTFTNWITNIVFPLIPNFLETVYTADLLSGMKAVLNCAIATGKLPIRIFENKSNAFYVYSNDDQTPSIIGDATMQCNAKLQTQNTEHQLSILKWKLITITEFDVQLRRIIHQFSVEFGRCWFAKNKEKLEYDAKCNDTYIDYYQKILGGNKMTDEVRFQRIRHALYNTLKENIKSIVEYDFV